MWYCRHLCKICLACSLWRVLLCIWLMAALGDPSLSQTASPQVAWPTSPKHTHKHVYTHTNIRWSHPCVQSQTHTCWDVILGDSTGVYEALLEDGAVWQVYLTGNILFVLLFVQIKSCDVMNHRWKLIITSWHKTVFKSWPYNISGMHHLALLIGHCSVLCLKLSYGVEAEAALQMPPLSCCTSEKKWQQSDTSDTGYSIPTRGVWFSILWWWTRWQDNDTSVSKQDFKVCVVKWMATSH